MKILIIEDEEDLANAIARGLKKNNYAVDIANDGQEGLDLKFINEYDLIILDLNLPSKDGFEILSEIRKTDEECKILILSAKAEYHQRIKGLDMGANDYLTKPFDFGELAARIRALLRRNFEQKSSKLICKNIKIDTASREAYTIEGIPLELSPKEFAILEYLTINKGKIISSEELLEHIWDSDSNMFSNAIKVHISTLRKKLGQYCEKEIILNRRGVGYIIKDEEESND